MYKMAVNNNNNNKFGSQFTKIVRNNVCCFKCWPHRQKNFNRNLISQRKHSTRFSANISLLNLNSCNNYSMQNLGNIQTTARRLLSGYRFAISNNEEKNFTVFNVYYIFLIF